MIESLPYRRVVSIRNKINTTGSEPLHLICDDYESYYVKNDRQNVLAVSMINEVLCHYFLRLWHINTPDISLVNLEKETFQKDYGLRHRPAYYYRPAFGSKEFPEAFDASEILHLNGRVDYRKYCYPLMFAHIGLFDMWVENDDRPPDLKNLMLFETSEEYHFLAIDHAMAFRTGAYGTLADQAFWPTEEQYLLQSPFFRQLRKFLKEDANWYSSEKRYFYSCIAECQRHFTDIVQLLPPEWGFDIGLQTILYNYLFNNKRNQSVFNEYASLWQ